MIIRYLELRNFLSHEHERLTIPEHGVIQLAGNSGAGKSSLISDAVGFALFGFRATRAPKVDELRRLDAPSKAFGVTVAFVAADGTIIEIERGLDEKERPVARLTSSSGDHAQGVKAVEERIRELFGAINPRVYYRAFVSRQDDITALTEMEGSKRRDFVHQMLGIDSLDAVGARLRAREREHGAVVRLLETQVGEESSELLDRLHREAVTGAQDAAESLEKASGASDCARREVADEQALLVPLRAARERIAEAEQKVAVADASLAGLDAEIARADRLIARRAEAEALVEGLEDLERRHAQASAELEELRRVELACATRSRIGSELEGLLAARAALGARMGDERPAPAESSVSLREQRADLVARHRSLTERREEIALQRSQLADQGTCSQCLRALEAHDHATLESTLTRQIQEADDQIAACEREGAAIRERIGEVELLEASRSDRERLAQQAADLDSRISALRQEVEGLPAGGGRLDDQERMRSEVAELSTGIERAHKAARWLIDDLPGLEAGRVRLGTDADALRSSRAEAAGFLDGAPDVGDLPRREQELDALRDRATRLEVEAAHALSRRDRSDAAVVEIERRRLERARRESELTGARDEAARHRDLAVLTVGFRKQVTAEIRPQLEETTSEVMSALSDGRHPLLRISEDYEIELRSSQPAGWLPVRMMSGGEKTRANFALRLALTRLVSQRTACPIRYLVLDEIFGSQDPDHRSRMLDVLRQVQVFYPQVFLISHVGDLRNSAVCDWVIEISDGASPQRARLIGT
ncbi:AAA family ATPase [Miltoncostaea oceani]|uniref:AAA family ATPase n=1 Tax=Miltoncostaea oceani TaxID=2843216 RepID=UPI001C3DD56B|nr:SMC family ATPase [Miltoncostaea oceani]